MLTEKSFDTGEIVINFAEGETAGIPLVMLHGSTLRWHTFGEFIPTLEESWNIYACDLRGHGKSGRASSGYRIADFVPDTVAFIERCIGRPVLLLGYSMGANVALGVAARLPKLIQGIVLLEPGLILRDSSITQVTGLFGWLTWIRETLASSPTIQDVIARLKELSPEQPEMDAQNDAKMILDIDPESIAYFLNDRVFENFDLEQLLPQVICPTLLVRGEPELGSLVRDTDVALFEAHVPHTTTIQIRGEGHGIIWGPPGKDALEHVTRFLNSQ